MSPRDPSQRILDFVDALPLEPGMRVLEIGCGPGVAARAVARRIKPGFVLAIDRSSAAIEIARRRSVQEVSSGMLEFRKMSAEELSIDRSEAQYDLAFAMRVGAFDGRHPASGRAAMLRLRSILATHGRFFVDTGDPVREIDIWRE